MGTSFYQCTKEYVINSLGGYYEICERQALLERIIKIQWLGLWRKGTRDKMPEFIRQLRELSIIIRDYL